MRRRRLAPSFKMISTAVIGMLLSLAVIDVADAYKRRASSAEAVPPASPTAEALRELAQAMGAAAFAPAPAPGKPIVKRLIQGTVDEDLEDTLYQAGVIGKPGLDFPVFPSIPTTGFNCQGLATGYYADLETACQVFHICDNGKKISFLCPNGTIFQQTDLICDWWFKVTCETSPSQYDISAEKLSREQKKRDQINKSLSHHKNSELQNINADASNINNGVINLATQTNKNFNSAPQSNIGTVSKISFSSTGFSTSREPGPSNERPTNSNPIKEFTNDFPSNNIKATSRSFQVIIPEDNVHTGERQQQVYDVTTAKQRATKRRKLNHQNNYQRSTKSTNIPNYTNSNAYRITSPTPIDYNVYKESQVPAETAAFASNGNRQYFQHTFNNLNNNDYKSLPTYSSPPSIRANRLKTTTATFSSSYVPDMKNLGELIKSTQSTYVSNKNNNMPQKRPTLVPYIHPTTISKISNKHQPFTRPGVWYLKKHLEKIKNNTSVPTEIDNAALRLSKTYNETVNFRSTEKPSLTKSEESNTPSNEFHYAERRQRLLNNLDGIETTTVDKDESDYHERRQKLTEKIEDIESSTTELPTTEKYFGKRPGLIVPPSLTPHTLHSLAIYYATALDNLATTTENIDNNYENLTPTEASTILEEEQFLTPLLSQNTIEKYSTLFGANSDWTSIDSTSSSNNTYNDISVEDLSASQSQGPLASSPQIRELAQVFTHALSAYLQDPERFRKVLSEIRPTQPFSDFSMMTTTALVHTNSEDESKLNEQEEDELLGFSDDSNSKLKLNSAQIYTQYPTTDKNVSENIEIITTVAPYLNANNFRKPKSKPLSYPKGAYSVCCGGSYINDNLNIQQHAEDYDERNKNENSNILLLNLTNNSNYTDDLSGDNDDSDNLSDDSDSYTLPKYGGFQNNTGTSFAPYGKGVQPENATPIYNYSYSSDDVNKWESTEGTKSLDAVYSTISIDFEPPKIKSSIANTVDSTYEIGNRSGKNIQITSDAISYPQDKNEPQYNSQYVDESDELDNEEQLQQAHSQSFLSPQNDIHQNSKNKFSTEYENHKTEQHSDITYATEKSIVKTSNDDWTLQPTTSTNDASQTSIINSFSTDNTKLNNDFATTVSLSNEAMSNNQGDYKNIDHWSTNFGDWQSTVILDPLTLNDGLSNNEHIPTQTTNIHFNDIHSTLQEETRNNVVPSTTPLPNYNKYEYSTNDLQQSTIAPASIYTIDAQPTTVDISHISQSERNSESRQGKALPSFNSESLDVNIDDSMMQKAKEVLVELNVTSADSLMNVMKKTKSKSVRRLILLLVQTCDDDHNKTAEASKRALLDALKNLSEREALTTTEAPTETFPTTDLNLPVNADVEDARLITNSHRRMDLLIDLPKQNNHQENIEGKRRRSKKIRFESNNVNRITFSPTTEKQFISSESARVFSYPVNTENEVFTTLPPIPSSPKNDRRGTQKFNMRSTTENVASTSSPVAAARISSQIDEDHNEDSKTSDTRALELLRSLYTLAARWG